MISDIKAKGDVEIIVEHKSKGNYSLYYPNTVLLTGRRALAKSLANNIGDSYSFYITRMLFGDGGTTDGIKKWVNANRNGLFGVTRISKPVIATIDGSLPSQVIFTAVIPFDEGVGMTLNEMALLMANEDLYSMVTFADLNKTEEMQLLINWHLNFI